MPAKPAGSVWMETVTSPGYPALPPDAEPVDVAVIGGGLTGILCAALLAADGRSVAVVEADRLACSTTGHTTAKVTSQHGMHYAEMSKMFGPHGTALYADAQEAAITKIEELAQGIDCGFRRAPSALYTTTVEKVEELEREASVAREAGLPSRFEPAASPLPFPVAATLWFDNQAMFHSRAFVMGLADRLAGSGVRIYEQTRVKEVHEKTDHVVVEAESGATLTAQHAIIATHLPFPKQGLYFAKSAPYSSYAITVEVDGDFPQEMYLSVDEPTRSLRPYEFDGERLLIVGGESHKTGQEDDHESHYAALEVWARSTFPVKAVRHRWSAYDFKTIDGVPYIGRLGDGTQRLWTATGYKKWGMTNSCVAAMILTDAIAERDNPWASVFNSLRPPPAGAMKELAGENLNVAKRFFGDRMRSGEPLETLQPGEATVVRRGLHQVAAYRDEQGMLHAVSAKCTHLGCIVRWNDAELTWDCPCHGSRFRTDGSVIEGPATAPLEQVSDIPQPERS